MKMKLSCIVLVLVMMVSSGGFVGAQQHADKTTAVATTSSYSIQWEMDYGTDPWSCARYQGPQPIGDADNDGLNELLISGRDEAIRVMKWDTTAQDYVEANTLHPPFYPFVQCDAGGMAIGDVTNNGKNEVAATWYTTVYRYFLSRYWIIGVNPWIFYHGGGSADCLIGDCDNDGKNELILSGGSGHGSTSTVPEITVFRWNGLWLQRVASWKDPDVNGYVYMAGLGDVDNDGLNELVCAYEDKLLVLNWDPTTKEFQSTQIAYNFGHDYPFGVVCKDADNDGKAEIVLSYYAPRITIFKWDSSEYTMQFDITWPEGDPVIEGIDVGDTDNDGANEVVAGAGVTHIMQWNGSTYVEEAVLPTWGWIAVANIGDTDNDGKNEINLGNVDVENGQHFMEWVYKYE
jgi:hypothetical protein